MSQQLINAVTKNYMKNDVPEFRAGDTVRVHVRIKERNKEPEGNSRLGIS